MEELKQKILSREVRVGELKDGVFTVAQTVTVGDIIDPEQDMWITHDGKAIISHDGVQRLAAAVKAHWDAGRLEASPNQFNDNGWYYMVTCHFPDGSQSHATGEANNSNAKSSISSGYKQTMARKRGEDRSFLNSQYMGLFDVYSDGESDSFNRLNMIQEENENYRNEMKLKEEEFQNAQKKLGQNERTINVLLDLVALPATDEKYPNTYVGDIWNEHKDRTHLQELAKNAEQTKTGKVIAFVAKRILEQAEQAERAEEIERQRFEQSINQDQGEETEEQEKLERGKLEEMASEEESAAEEQAAADGYSEEDIPFDESLLRELDDVEINGGEQS